MKWRSSSGPATQKSHTPISTAKVDGAAGTARRRDEELRQLMTGYQRGEAAAVEQLVARLSPSLLRFFAWPDLSVFDAEDLLQDCWMRIHQSRHTWRPAEPLLPWIFAIARHARLDGYRRRRRLSAREIATDTLPERAIPSPSVPREQGNLAPLMSMLPESQREVLLMLKVSGMSVEEVARATGTTTGAIKQKAHRAYVKLRELLAKDSGNAQ